MGVSYYQGVMWQTREGEYVNIKDMDPKHARATARMLERNASNIALRYCINEAAHCSLLGEHALDAFEQMLDGIMDDPVGWIHSTPLFKALVQRGHRPPIVEFLRGRDLRSAQAWRY